MTFEEAVARNNQLGAIGGNTPALDTTATVIPHNEPAPITELPKIMAQDAAQAGSSILSGVANLPANMLNPILAPLEAIIEKWGMLVIVLGFLYLLITNRQARTA